MAAHCPETSRAAAAHVQQHQQPATLGWTKPLPGHCRLGTRAQARPLALSSGARRSCAQAVLAFLPSHASRELCSGGGGEVLPQRPSPGTPLPPTVNFFIEPRCNYECSFCYETMNDLRPQDVVRDTELLLATPALLAAAGANKVTFVGGEPFLHPLIEQLIVAAKRAGLVTCVVTNGSALDAARLERLAGHLDWIAFSVDASDDALHAAMGRGTAAETAARTPRHGRPPGWGPVRGGPPTPGKDGRLAGGEGCGATTGDAGSGGGGAASGGRSGEGHLARVLRLWPVAQRLGYRLKLNTVVTAANLHDGGMVDLVGRLRPERWKAFQVLPIPGQTRPELVGPLLISAAEFRGWVARNAVVQQLYGVPLVAEDNDAMLGSYAMLDPAGRFFSDMGDQGHVYGPSVYDCWRRRLMLAPAQQQQQQQPLSQQQHASSSSGGGGGVPAPAAAAALASLSGAALAVLCADGAAPGSGAAAAASAGGGGADVASAALAAGAAAVRDAWDAVAGPRFRAERFAARGGVYEWGQGDEALQQQEELWGAGSGSTRGGAA